MVARVHAVVVCMFALCFFHITHLSPAHLGPRPLLQVVTVTSTTTRQAGYFETPSYMRLEQVRAKFEDLLSAVRLMLFLKTNRLLGLKIISLRVFLCLISLKFHFVMTYIINK